ncbi:hypothetical protein [Streptomyces microflavus]|uniref:hypothetical protein n=1 Tax=Streptomyces microflavus TaxID=1919 RepID=UPI00367394DB
METFIPAVAEGIEIVLLRIRVDVRHPSDPEYVLAQWLEDVPDDFGYALHQAAQNVVAAVAAPLDVGNGSEVRVLVDDRGTGALLGCLPRFRVGRRVSLCVGVGRLGEPDCHTADAEYRPAPDLKPAVAGLLVHLGELLGLGACASRIGVLAQLFQRLLGAAHQKVLLHSDPTGDRPEVARLDVDGAVAARRPGRVGRASHQAPPPQPSSTALSVAA